MGNFKFKIDRSTCQLIMLWSHHSLHAHHVRSKRQRTKALYAAMIDAPTSEIRQRPAWNVPNIGKHCLSTAQHVVNRLGRSAEWSCDTQCRNVINGFAYVCNRPCACVVCPWCVGATTLCPGAQWTGVAFPFARQSMPRVLSDPVHVSRVTAAALAAFEGSMHMQILAALRRRQALQRRAGEFGIGLIAYKQLVSQQLWDSPDYLALMHVGAKPIRTIIHPTDIDRLSASLFRRRRPRTPRITCGLSMLDAETANTGLSVGRVDVGSSAEDANIVAGCVITAVNGRDIRGLRSNAASRVIFTEIEKPIGCWAETSIASHVQRGHAVRVKRSTRLELSCIPSVPPAAKAIAQTRMVSINYYFALPPHRLARIEPRITIPQDCNAQLASALTLINRANELNCDRSGPKLPIVVLADSTNSEVVAQIKAVLTQPGMSSVSGSISDGVKATFFFTCTDAELSRVVEVSPVTNDAESTTIAVMEAARGASYVVMTSFSQQQAVDASLNAVKRLQAEAQT